MITSAIIVDDGVILNKNRLLLNNPSDADEYLHKKWKNLYNQWLAEGNTPDVLPEPSEPPKVREARLKLEGVEFEGVMCSATALDQFGLDSIERKIREKGKSYYFEFANDNKLLLTPDNIDSFEDTWVAFRESFFPLP